MEYTPRKFDNSDEAIKEQEAEIYEAKEFVYGWIKDKGLSEDYIMTGLDFDDVFSVLADYMHQLINKPQ